MTRKGVYVGRLFGDLTVASPAKHANNGSRRWECHCICGQSYVVREALLRQGTYTKCPRCRFGRSFDYGEGTPDCSFAHENVLFRVSDVCGLKADLIRHDRHVPYTNARRLVAMILREQGHSFQSIAAAMEKNHTSVMRMCRYNRRDVEKTLLTYATADGLDSLHKLVPVGATPRRPSDADTERDDYDKAVNKMLLAPASERLTIWKKLCRAIYPTSYRYQIAMLPRRVRELQAKEEEAALRSRPQPSTVLVRAAQAGRAAVLRAL